MHSQKHQKQEVKQLRLAYQENVILQTCPHELPLFIDSHPQPTWVIGLEFLHEQTLQDHPLEQEVKVINALEKNR